MFEGHAELPDTKLWYWDTGGTGETIILCHPGSQSSRVWEFQRETFAGAGYRVIAYSRRGFDRSDPVDGENPGTAVDDLLNLLDACDVETAHLLGAAAGGLSALAVAVAKPERVAKLILAGTIFAPDEEAWRQMYARLGMAQFHAAMSVEFIELGPSYRATNPEGTARFAELAACSRQDKNAAQPTGANVTWQALENLSVPTLLVTGEADLYAPPPLQALVGGHFKNQRSLTLPEVGHAPYWEAPAEFNAIVLEFLGNADAPAG